MDRSDTEKEGSRTARELYRATLPFVAESPARTWSCVGTTFVLMIACLFTAGAMDWWPARTGAAILGSLFMVRCFILYHDLLHGAIMRRSAVGRGLLRGYGLFTLTPANSWRRSHNHHHAHVGKIPETGVGSFELMTVDMWMNASWTRRLVYRLGHHPGMIMCSYLVVFLFNICLMPFVRNPRRHWDSLLSLVVHVGTIVVLWSLFGFMTAFFAFLLPVVIASALGGYLFYAQHNFDGMKILPSERWNPFDAAVASSSYLKLWRIARYFTGNIGYHHVHHLNPRIPFYRLPEAMAAIPELQNPATTTLHPLDVAKCFRMTLWDPDAERMVSYRQARRERRLAA